MNTKTRVALSSIAVLYLTSLIGCSGGGSTAGGNGGNGDSATLTATVTGLAPNTRYYFAVSAYNDLNGLCSNEVSTTTPPSGAVSLE